MRYFVRGVARKWIRFPKRKYEGEIVKKKKLKNKINVTERYNEKRREKGNEEKRKEGKGNEATSEAKK